MKVEEEGRAKELQLTWQLTELSLEAVFVGRSVRSLLLGNQHSTVEGSNYFCHSSFQGPDWQLFLEHTLLPPPTGEGGRGDVVRRLFQYHFTPPFTHANKYTRAHMDRHTDRKTDRDIEHLNCA